ncbi:hypothetical protein VIAE108258_21370 [Vibrio aerogenes]
MAEGIADTLFILQHHVLLTITAQLPARFGGGAHRNTGIRFGKRRFREIQIGEDGLCAIQPQG